MLRSLVGVTGLLALGGVACAPDVVSPGPTARTRIASRPAKNAGAAGTLSLNTADGVYTLDVSDRVLYMPDGQAAAVDDSFDLAVLRRDFELLDRVGTYFAQLPPSVGDTTCSTEMTYDPNCGDEPMSASPRGLAGRSGGADPSDAMPTTGGVPFSCQDIAKAMLAEKSTYQAARAAYEASLSVARSMVTGTPATVVKPGGVTLPKWTDVKTRAKNRAIEIGIAWVITGATRMMYDASLARLGLFKTMWDEQNCWDWALGPGGSGGGSNGGTTSYTCSYTDYYDGDGNYLYTVTNWCVANTQ